MEKDGRRTHATRYKIPRGIKRGVHDNWELCCYCSALAVWKDVRRSRASRSLALCVRLSQHLCVELYCLECIGCKIEISGSKWPDKAYAKLSDQKVTLVVDALDGYVD